MIIFSVPNFDASQEFISWLKGVLLNPGIALRFAKHCIAFHDWNKSLNVEIQGRYTKTGVPEVYTFQKEDMKTIEIE